MPLTTHTSSRFLALIGLIVGLAVVTPPALAGTNQNGPLDPWAYALVHRSAAETQQYGPLDPWAYAAIHRSDASRPSMVPAINSEGDGINWGDAGIGAAVAFGLMVLVAGGTVVVRKRVALVRPRF
jgi:hypothetical protein